jgi:hypothetical protein
VRNEVDFIFLSDVEEALDTAIERVKTGGVQS